MKIKDCKHYAVVDISTAAGVLQERITRDVPFSEENDLYEETEQPGLKGHKLTYMGYVNVDNPHKSFKGEPDYFKLHIFVDNYWPFSMGEK